MRRASRCVREGGQGGKGAACWRRQKQSEPGLSDNYDDRDLPAESVGATAAFNSSFIHPPEENKSANHVFLLSAISVVVLLSCRLSIIVPAAQYNVCEFAWHRWD